MTIEKHERSTKDLVKAAVSGWLGTALEFMDFQLYSLGAALVFHEIFFPESSTAMALILAMGTYGAGYVARIVGAFIFGKMGVTYNKEGVVTEHPDDKWALRECFTCKLPMQKVEDLAAYVDYPICKMLITLDPARRDEVLEAGRKQFAGEIDLYPSSPFFIEAVPLGVAKDVSLGSLFIVGYYI